MSTYKPSIVGALDSMHALEREAGAFGPRTLHLVVPARMSTGDLCVRYAGPVQIQYVDGAKQDTPRVYLKPLLVGAVRPRRVSLRIFLRSRLLALFPTRDSALAYVHDLNAHLWADMFPGLDTAA